MIARRPLGDRRLDGRNVDAELRKTHVDRHRDGSCLAHRLPGRDERHRRHDHLVTRTDVKRRQGQPDGIQAARHADGVGDADILSERPLELGDGLVR